VVSDPVIVMAAAMASGDPDLEALAAAAGSAAVAAEELDGSAAPMALEAGQALNPPDGLEVPLAGPRLEREYLWGPGDGWGAGGAGVDELLVQYDGERKPWWALMDAGGDLVALAAPAGPDAASMVAAQWTYDAYGKVVTADHISAHAFAHLGHKGLFVDRLDGAVTGEGMPGAGGGEAPRLGPFAETYAHVRHRVYFSALGRWGQADPNASGVSIQEDSSFHGVLFMPGVMEVDLGERYGDGSNLYQYLASQPWTRNDPTGLFSYLDTMVTVGLQAAAIAIPGPSDMIRGALSRLVDTYSGYLEDDADWASEWGWSDDWHSRGSNVWVAAALGQGLYDSFEIGIPFTDIGFNPLDAFAGKANPGLGGKRPRNAHLAGKYHPFEWDGVKIRFNIRGHPVFNPPIRIAEVKIRQTGSYSGDFKLADQEAVYAVSVADLAAGKKPRTKGYSWHHHEDKTTMQLVPTKLHEKVGHTGGYTGK